MVKATVTAHPERVRTLAQAIAINSSDRRTIQGRLDAIFRRHEEEAFASEGASSGSPWKELSPLYATRKASARRGISALNKRLRASTHPSQARPVSQKILQYSGNLERSLTNAGHSEHVSETEGTPERFTIVLGTRNPLANIHRKGGGRLPARDPIQHTEAQKRAYLEDVRAFEIAKVRAALRSLRSSSR